MRCVMDDETTAPGMDAIHAAMVSLHGPQEPKHWLLDSSLGMLGSRLESASAYDAGDHWHFVTLGLSNIWERAEDDSAVSGLGYEFTMRVRHPARSRWSLSRDRVGEPPQWAVRFLQRLGDVTLEGSRFRPGETLDPGGAITGDASNGLVAVGFVDDPSLPLLSTPNGTVAFIQVFGMTTEQLDVILRGESELRSFAGSGGLFVTDPHARR
jgi:suppressor of fused